MLAVPAATAVTCPSTSTEAMASSSEVHVSLASWISVPSASSTDARTVAVAPGPPSVSDLGAISTDAGICVTVIVAVAVSAPDVAVITAVPLASAVTNPVAEMVATVASEEVQVTEAPFITEPFWSDTLADSCVVAPRAESETTVADRAIVVATAGGVST
jgi:hypothetical protein